MSISVNIKEIHEFVKNNLDANGQGDGRDVALEMKALAGEAIRDGMKSRAWAKYMSKIAKTPEQLKRLIGEDEAFNATEWGTESLVYIAANSTCGIDTTIGTINGFTPEMIANLDKDV